MKCLVLLLSIVGLVVAPLPKMKEIIIKIAGFMFRQYLKSKMKGEGLVTKIPVRGMIPPDINPEEYSGKFQGDIVLDDPSIDDMLRNAFIAADVHWPNNTVVWQFKENDFDEEQRAAVQDAIYLIENNTCVRFRKREPNETVYVQVTGYSTGCYSMVGYHAKRGVHVLNFSPHIPGTGCLRIGTIVHEFMHILGFFHMHSVYNRDDYVRVVEENILPGMESHFYILGSDMVSNLGVEYDYLSCLHYSAYAFSAGGKPTIEALQKFDGLMGQRDYVTDSDWLRINRYYDCPGAWD